MTATKTIAPPGIGQLVTIGSPTTRIIPTAPQPLAVMDYRHPSHQEFPHVVKFSGGRSSATLTFELAEAGLLRPERGDVILFANTSAEHPGTYEFAARCKERLEREFGLPFFWFEFCTVEDAVRGEYRRKLSYRLVKPVPVEADPHGYHSGGEVFEEFLSFQGMLPSPQQRSCTAKMKLWPSHLLLAEWFANSDGPMHSGHFAQSRYISPTKATKRYKAKGGQLSYPKFFDKIQYAYDQPHHRAAQVWQDYTLARISKWNDPTPSGRRQIWGHNAQRHLTLLGLRADEKRRVNRVLDRTMFSEGATTLSCEIRTQPPGEHPYFPLFDAKAESDDVKGYWNRPENRDFDLDIPDWAGNCTYCFMKGTRSIEAGVTDDLPAGEEGRPADINWWIDMEEKYQRTVKARDKSGKAKTGKSTFGFMGVSGMSYQDIADGKSEGRFATGTPACDCTD